MRAIMKERFMSEEIITYSAKAYEELDFADDFMFCKVLTNNPDICKELAELITGRKIERIGSLEKQKEIKKNSDGKGVRFDVYFKDNKNTVYDFEMQTEIKKNLPKRTRFYQSIIDAENLRKSMDYIILPDSYIVFICKEDPFHESFYKYTFEERCTERLSVRLDDGTKKIFINASGTEGRISDDLKAFIDYIAYKKTESSLTKKIEHAVIEARRDEKWRDEYMFLYERDQINEEKGVNKGMILGTIATMREDGRPDEDIAARIEKNYHLSSEQAKKYISSFVKV